MMSITCTCINDGWLIISVSPSSDSESGPTRRDVKYSRKTYKLKKKNYISKDINKIVVYVVNIKLHNAKKLNHLDLDLIEFQD